MARVGRYKGAIVVEAADGAWLVGNPKEPCAELPDTLAAPYVRALPPVAMAPGFVVDGDAAEPLARALAARLVIQRNGSVSERLWRLILDGSRGGEPRLQWLLDMPEPVWNIVRDSVLRCS